MAAAAGAISAYVLSILPNTASLDARLCWHLTCAAIVGLLLVGRTSPFWRTVFACGAVFLAVTAGGRADHEAKVRRRLPDNMHNLRLVVTGDVVEACRPAITPCSFALVVVDAAARGDTSGEGGPFDGQSNALIGARLQATLQEGSWVPLPGDRFQVEGRIRVGDQALHPFAFDAASWTERRGYQGRLTLDAPPVLLSVTPSFGRSVQARRAAMEHAMRRFERPEAAGVLVAMSTGTKSGLSEDVRARFAAAGTAHVLAVSGLHLGLMTAALWFVLLQIFQRIPALLARTNIEALSAGLTLPAILTYVLFTGAPTSAMRAGLMASAVLIPRFVYARSSSLHALSLAVFFLLCHRPSLIVDMGFQLSVAATLSLVLLANVVRQQRRRRPSGSDDEHEDPDHDPLVDSDPETSEHAHHHVSAEHVLLTGLPRFGGATDAASSDDDPPSTVVVRLLDRLKSAGVWIAVSTEVSVVSTLATAPFLVWGFGGLPILSPLPNLLIVPPLSLIALPLGSIGAALDAMGATWCGEPLIRLALWVIDACLWLSRVGAPVFELEALFGRPLLLGVIGWALIALCSPYLTRGRSWRAWTALAVGAMLVTVDWGVRQPRSGELQIHAIPVGQGDATLIVLPDGHRLLIDAGGSGFGRSSTGARYVLPYLRGIGVRRIHTLIATHGDADHIAGITELVPLVQPDRIWVGNHDLRRPLERALYQAAKAQRIPYALPHAAWRDVTIGAVTLQFLPVDHDESSNDGSLVIRLCYDAICALFVGDAEGPRERSLLASDAELHAHYLKIGHHGSKTSSHASFLDAVGMSVAVAHVGPSNRYGFPHDEVVDRLRARRVALWRTDRGEAIVHTSDGRSLWRLRRRWTWR